MVPLSVPIASLFSQEQRVQDILWFYLITVPSSYGFQGIIMMAISGLNAIHMPLKAFLWSFARLFLFTLPCAWIGSKMNGAEGIFIGIAVGNIIGGILAYGYMIVLEQKSVFHL